VKYYLSAADLITQTYRTATQSGISQLAFHFEKPMLVTNVGGLGEIIHHEQSGLVASPDSESIMNSLELFSSYTNPELFREAIREEKKKYSWEAFTEVLLS
jgi:glycosyltransferase involved in cell wall biosynthesis